MMATSVLYINQFPGTNKYQHGELYFRHELFLKNIFNTVLRRSLGPHLTSPGGEEQRTALA
jgi:hypothetical protein